MSCIKVNNIYGIRKSNHFQPIKEDISSHMRGFNILFRKHTCVCIMKFLYISESTNRKHWSLKIVSVLLLNRNLKLIPCKAERFIIPEV